MIKLDKKDRKILYQLDVNSRQSANQIGRKVGLPRSVVNYRIARLKEKGIIKNFYTLIDAISLGFIPIRIHIKFQNTTSKIVKEIVDYFINNKFSTLVGLAEGFFDLSVVIEVRDIHDFYDVWQKVKMKYGYYFEDYSLSFFISEMRFNQSFLLLDDANKSDREEYLFVGKRSVDPIDNLDMKLLQSISADATISLLDMSKKFDISSVAIQYRLKKLIEKKVILGYKVNIDLRKIGYQKSKAYIKLNDFSKRTDIINFIKYDNNLVNVDTNTGESDIELEFVLESVGKLRDIMDQLIDKYPKAIKNYDIISEIRLLKFVYFPAYF